MIIHSVYFTLHSGADPVLREQMLVALRDLSEIPQVRRLAAGSPAEVPARSVLDTNYDFALIIETDDATTLAAYQADPAHKAFLERFSPGWARVRVFDVAIPPFQ